MEASPALSATAASEPVSKEVAAADLEPKASGSMSPEIPSGSARKNGGLKDTGRSLRFSINKSTSQFKKTPHRKSASPLNWFPRKKSDSFLKRKIRQLQEVEGRSLSLDETLGNANPHYTRMTKEKIAAKEAARKAMEAHKAAMVEASWCRILRAARIQSKKAEALLEKTEKCAIEAFEAARVMGVMMYDKPDNPWQSSETEPSSVIGGRSIHTVTASFETAFEVDKEVSVAVKKAFIQLANSHSSNKEEFRALLRKISENPDNETNSETISSESESDSKSELGTEGEDFSGGGVSDHDPQVNQGKNRSLQNSDECSNKSSKTSVDLVTKMLDRLKELQEDELSSLATIVATCGLNAALREVESGKDLASRNSTIPHLTDTSGKETATRLPSLDKFLVKRVSRLEKEVQEARNSKKTSLVPGFLENSGASSEDGATKCRLVNPNCGPKFSETTSDLGSILVKRVSRLEREVQEARSSNKNSLISGCVQLTRPAPDEGTAKSHSVCPNSNLISLDTISDLGIAEDSIKASSDPTLNPEETLSTHLSHFEQKVEVIPGEKSLEEEEYETFKVSQGATEKSQNLELKESVALHPLGERNEKENTGSERPPLLPKKSLAKHMSRIERAKLEALKAFSSLDGTNEVNEPVGLDKILVKSVHRLESGNVNEKENIDINTNSLTRPMSRIERAKLEALKAFSCLDGTNEAIESAGLDKILVQSVHRMESENVNEKENIDINTNSLTRPMSRIERAKLEALKAFSCEANEPAGLDKIFVKSVHGLEKEKKMHASEQGNDYTVQRNSSNQGNKVVASDSLDQILVKHVSRLEKEKAAAGPRENFRKVKKTAQQSENFESLESILVKSSQQKHELEKEKEKMHASKQGSDYTVQRNTRNHGNKVAASDSLDQILVKHVSRLEKEKAAVGPREVFRQVKKSAQQYESLESILVKSQPKQETTKLVVRELDDLIKPVDDRRKAREKELHEAWGGLSLGNSVRPHLSKLEQEKAAWRRAEEDEQRRMR